MTANKKGKALFSKVTQDWVPSPAVGSTNRAYSEPSPWPSQWQPGYGYSALLLIFIISFSKSALYPLLCIRIESSIISASIPYISQIYHSLGNVIFPLIYPKILSLKFKDFALKGSRDPWTNGWSQNLGREVKVSLGYFAVSESQEDFSD